MVKREIDFEGRIIKHGYNIKRKRIINYTEENKLSSLLYGEGITGHRNVKKRKELYSMQR